MAKDHVLRPVKVQEFIYHLESWNQIKSVLHSDYEKIKTSIDVLLSACKDLIDDTAKFEVIDEAMQEAIERYYQSVLDHAVRLLNENYRKQFIECQVSLIGVHAAAEKTLLGEISLDGWFKIVLPASSKYDSILHIPPSFQTVQLGSCAFLLDPEPTKVEHVTFSELPSERILPIENFILQGFNEVTESIYTMGEDPLIFFPRLDVENNLNSSEISILVSLRPLTKKK